jgi:putative ABC transport system ATP-binding protein
MGLTDVRAIHTLSISIESGEFIAIMGASGSGKSTLLNIIGCLDRPTAGRYILDGCDVSTMDDDQLSAVRLAKLGFIFQSFNLLPHLSVLRNIELPLYYLGWSREDSRHRAAELADLVGLSPRMHHKPSELSGGQRQRVAIARSLANNPAVILADEPTGNLDSQTGTEIMSMLKKLHHDGKTIVMVTHENSIADYAERRIHMRDGLIINEELAS